MITVTAIDTGNGSSRKGELYEGPAQKTGAQPWNKGISVPDIQSSGNLARLAVQEKGLRRPNRHGDFWMSDENLVGESKEGEDHQIW